MIIGAGPISGFRMGASVLKTIKANTNRTATAPTYIIRKPILINSAFNKSKKRNNWIKVDINRKIIENMLVAFNMPSRLSKYVTKVMSKIVCDDTDTVVSPPDTSRAP